MRLSKVLTTVTPLSRMLALLLFIALPFVGFYAGTQYQARLMQNEYPTPTPTPERNQTLCTQEVKLCPDGSYVARSGPRCEFAPCPKTSY